jgi:hypothetical protein
MCLKVPTLLTLQRQFGHEQTLKEPGRRLAIPEWPGWHLAVRGGKALGSQSAAVVLSVVY